MKAVQKKDDGYKTIRVGGAAADIPGFTSGAIQLAADALAACGGGTIELSGGVFAVDGPVRLGSNMHLKGAGRATVLKKAPGFSSGFLQDVDYGVFSATVERAERFTPGTGILIRDSAGDAGWAVSTSKVTGVEGNTIHFDRRTLLDYTRENGGTVSNACSLIEAIKAENVRISNLAIDGSKDTNLRMDGCRGGAIYLHKASSCSIEDVLVSDFNGDGISWQITEDISVLRCEVCGCTGFGMHPGTGSARTLMEGCSMHGNGSDGLFVCWRVQHGVFRNNSFCDNGGSGICIGHKDTDNLFEGNRICRNNRSGVHTRNEAEGNRADRNVYRGNTVEDNGGDGNGCGFLFDSAVEGNVIEGNTIQDTGAGRQKAGIACRKGAGDGVSAKNNKMSGHTSGDIVTI